ncbi:MAG: alpha-L-fucosidase [Phycisphaerae bacterium]|nr:alpha-L-fucosidase [Phycisphaerae bacterium]
MGDFYIIQEIVMSLFKRIIVSCVVLLVSASCGAVEKDISKVDPVAMKRWQDMRFGMFIHWGPVSLTGHEIGWSRGNQTPIATYDQLYKQFNPTRFDADQWVRIAKETGMKYIILTTKHHDGFCLWDTKQTEYNIMNSPFGRDVVKELAAACKKQGIAFGTYYSTCDWHHPDFPRTSPGGQVSREKHNLDRYTGYLKAQVRELLVNYGPLITLWYDVPQEFNAQRGQGVIDFTRSLQRDIIINNRTGARGDFDTPEQKIGGFNRDRPWETCMTICQQWAWRPKDQMKSAQQCIQTLLQTAGGDGNLLFNVGPMPDGRIEPRQVERLKEMGDWLKKYGHAIYGTRGGPFKPGYWGASTCNEDKIYLFVMNWPKTGPLKVPILPMKVTKAALKPQGDVKMKRTEQAIELYVPQEKRNPIATVIELTVAGKAFDIPPVNFAPERKSAASGKQAKASNTFGNSEQYAPAKAFDQDPETRWATDAGTKAAWLEVDLGKEMTIGQAMIDEAWDRVHRFELQYKVDSQWKRAHAGTTLGAKKEFAFDPVTARYFKLNILEAVEGPTIWEMQLYEEK